MENCLITNVASEASTLQVSQKQDQIYKAFVDGPINNNTTYPPPPNGT